MGAIGKIIGGKYIPFANDKSGGGGSYDFIGTRAELQAKIDAGEDLSNVTAYLTDGDGDEETDGGEYVKKEGDTMTGALKVPTLILGSTPSDEIGAMWIE